MKAHISVASLALMALLPQGMTGDGAQPLPFTFTGPSSAKTPLTCDAPIRWYVAEVDPRFGLTAEEVEWRVREAGMLWEQGRDRFLFVHDDREGLPVRLIWDGRQEADRERREARGRLNAEEERLRELRSGLEGLRERAKEAADGYALRLARYEDDLRAYRAELAEWEARGGVPDRERTRLDNQRAALDRARNALDDEVDALNELNARVRSEGESVNRGIEALNRESAWFSREFASVDLLTGEYVEPGSRFGRRPAMRDREIRIYRFESPEHLTMALARELGRALGLPFMEGDDGVMGTGVVPLPGPDGPALTPRDREHLRTTCPRL